MEEEEEVNDSMNDSIAAMDPSDMENMSRTS